MTGLTPQTSFVEFCKQVGFKEPPKFMVDIADQLMTESKSSKIIISGGRGVNWIGYMENLSATFKALNKGKKCAVATRFPERFIKDFKGMYKISIELISIGDNLYQINIV